MKKVIRPLIWTLFVIYCLALIHILFLSRPPMTFYSIPEYFKGFSNFIPFKTIIEYIQKYGEGYQSLSFMNLAGNLFLFTPMGMGLPCLFKKVNRIWKMTLMVLAIVVLVEIAQVVLRVGSIDIDDVIFNVGGAMLGYGLIKIPLINKLLVKIHVIIV